METQTNRWGTGVVSSIQLCGLRVHVCDREREREDTATVQPQHGMLISCEALQLLHGNALWGMRGWFVTPPDALQTQNTACVCKGTISPSAIKPCDNILSAV